MVCLRPFGTLYQATCTFPPRSFPICPMQSSGLFFSCALKAVLYSSSLLPRKPQTSVSNRHPIQRSSFSLMEPVAYPAVPCHRPIRHMSHYPRACLICQAHFLATWAGASTQQDMSPGGEAKSAASRLVPRAHSPIRPGGAPRRAPFCWPRAPQPNPASDLSP